MDPGSPSPPTAMEPGEGGSQDLWYVGAIINVVGSIAINLGTNLMKLGHNKRAKMDLPDDQKPPVRRIKEWVIGMAFFSVGNILNFVSFGFAAQSLLAALGSIQFVSNVIFAYFVLREPINRQILIATTCIVGGCVLLVVFGNQSSATYTIHELTQLYKTPAYIVYLCLLGVGVVGGYLLYVHGTKVVSVTGPRGFWNAILPVSYSVFSALIGTQSVLFSKSMSVMVRVVVSGDDQDGNGFMRLLRMLANWYTWLVLVLFLMTAVFWITRLNKGLQMFPAMIIVPVMQIAWTLFSIVSGMLYFQEYVGFTPLKSVMFPMGVLVVFAGVFLLTQSGGAKKASYEKMEESAAAKAHMQDVGHKAFGSQDKPALDLAQRVASIDMTRQEGPVAAAKPEAPSPARLGTTHDVAAASLAKPAAPEEAAGEGGEASFTDERTVTPASPLKPAPAVEGVGEPVDRQSMLENIMRRMRMVQERLNQELLGVEARKGLRLAMGLGDSGMPGISLFAIPTVLDYPEAMAGRSSDTSVLSPKEASDAAKVLEAIEEDVEGLLGHRAAGGSGAQPLSDARQPAEQAQQPLQDSCSTPPRPATAPPSPKHGLGRSLIDRAERAAKTGIEAIKRAPSSLQRVVREKQGYGSLNDDEETGLLELTEPSDAAAAQGEGRR